jgi:hypothetical protein
MTRRTVVPDEHRQVVGDDLFRHPARHRRMLLSAFWGKISGCTRNLGLWCKATRPPQYERMFD